MQLLCNVPYFRRFSYIQFYHSLLFVARAQRKISTVKNVYHTKYFACLVFVSRAHCQKFFPGKNFPRYGICCNYRFYQVCSLGRSTTNPDLCSSGQSPIKAVLVKLLKDDQTALIPRRMFLSIVSWIIVYIGWTYMQGTLLSTLQFAIEAFFRMAFLRIQEGLFRRPSSGCHTPDLEEGLNSKLKC